jgi:PKD repeat protein
MPSYDNLNLNLCESLYGQGAGAHSAPHFTYRHADKVIAGEACPSGTSSVAGLAFYTGGTFPARYRDGLFFADYSRSCIWFMPAGANGLPDPSRRESFASGATGVVNLVQGPDGSLYYPDLNGGTIRRISYGAPNAAPTARATATPSSGAVPLTVQFDGTGSSDPNGDALTYAWDLDGDGAYDDGDGAQPQTTFPDDGTYSVAVQVTDEAGRIATDTAEVTIANAVPAISGARVNDGDPASFTAAVKDPGAQDVQTATIDWGDGAPAETVPVIATDDGYLVSASHEVPGTTVKLTVSDGDGGTATATATRVLAPTNASPTAAGTDAEVRQGEAVDVDLPATDPEGDRLAYEIVDAPEHGRVLMRALDPLAPEQPEVTYVADPDFTGEATFTYRVSDGTGKSAKATVTVAVEPLPADEGGPGPVEPDPELPAPEAPSEPEARGPGREGTAPIDPEVVEDATGEVNGEQGAPPPAASRIVQLPSAKRCVSRRKFRIRVRRIKGQGAYKRVEVSVNGKRTKVVHGVRDTATVDLRGLPKGRFKVRITVTLADGRKVSSTRKYRTCAKRPSTPKKKGGRL